MNEKDLKRYSDNGWRIVHGGDDDFPLNVAPQLNEKILVVSGFVHISNQYGGFVRACNNSRVANHNQVRGFCEGVEQSVIFSESQFGGHVQTFGDAELLSSNQSGGYCRAFNGKLKVFNYRAGVTESYSGNNVQHVVS